MIFDMTDYDSNLQSLVEFLDLTQEEILDFVILESTDVIDFLEAFEIKDEKLLEKNIELVSLHSTTSIDDCKSIKEKGLINLQDAVSQETSLKSYLDSKNIYINIEEKYILFEGNKFHLSESTEGSCLRKQDEYKNRVIHKFYDDFQVNGFICIDNIITYGGDTRYRPEILFDLANFLNNKDIELDWVNNKNHKHHIIKFKQPLNYYLYFTYEVEYEDNDFGVTKDSIQYLPNNVIEAKVKKWVIQNSLYIIKHGIFELPSYVHPHFKIEPTDIIEIMSEQEYIDKYKIDNN